MITIIPFKQPPSSIQLKSGDLVFDERFGVGTISVAFTERRKYYVQFGNEYWMCKKSQLTKI